jgi:hypothetical protein
MLTHIALATDIWDEIQRKQRLTAMVGLNFLSVMERFQAEEAKPRTKAQMKAKHLRRISR